MPSSRSRSCGSTGPSTIISPLLTTWPSCTSRCLSLAIRYSCSCLSRSVITRRCLPFVSLPKLTVPVTSASIPASLGERASNSSATRGRPPVMSRVFETSCGMRASTSPTATCWPSRTAITPPTGELMVTARAVGARALEACVAGVAHVGGARDHDLAAFRVAKVAHRRGEAHRARGLGLDVALHRGPRGGAADVEGPHRQLRARLADRLRGDHADRLADVDQRSAAEVAAVALGADAPAGVAAKRGTHLDLVDT